MHQSNDQMEIADRVNNSDADPRSEPADKPTTANFINVPRGR